MTDPEGGTANASEEVRAFDGSRLVVFRWGRSDAPRGTVIVVHGLKDHAARYDALARRLVGEGFRVFAPDLRGHGRSGGERQWVRRFSDYVDDLGRVAELGGPTNSSFVFAHSMGGAIALRWLVDRRPSLRGLALSGAAIRPPRSVGTGARAVTRLLGAVAPHAGLARLPPEDFSRNPATVAALAADPLVSPRPVPARTAAELLRSMAFVEARLGQIQVPVLAMHGSEDRLTDPAGSELLRARVGSGDVTYRPYPGLFHDLLHEPESEVVEGDLVQWLRDRSTGRPGDPSASGTGTPPAESARSPSK